METRLELPRAVAYDAAPPLSSGTLAGAAILTSSLVLAGIGVLLITDRLSGHHSWVLTTCALATTACAFVALLFAIRSGARSWRVRPAASSGHITRARELAADSRADAWWALSLQLAALAAGASLFVISTNEAEVQKVFLQWSFMRNAAPDVLRALLTNLVIVALAEPLILAFALLLAVLRLLPGREARPVRFLAIAFIDVFRGLPVLIVIYLVGFGLPLSGLPVVGHLSPTLYAVLALTLNYAAFVAETFRAGVESVHPSQVAAARSLGLSHIAALRYVVVPQAVRTVTAPLLTWFIGLQKDTALVGIVGTIDAFQQARIYSAEQFNLSAVILVSVLFVLITIPQARFVDWLLRRRNQQLGRL